VAVGVISKRLSRGSPCRKDIDEGGIVLHVDGVDEAIDGREMLPPNGLENGPRDLETAFAGRKIAV